jgi:hypothetical protein
VTARLRPTAALLGVLLLAVGLVGCGDDAPTWGAVDDSTCDALGIPALVARVLPEAEPAEVTVTSRTRGAEPDVTSETVCEVAAGDLRLAVELESSGASGETDLYGLRDGDEISVGGSRVRVDPEPVEGWWEEGVRVSATEAGAVSVQLTVADDNLTAAVRVSDTRGDGVADQGADEELASAVVDVVPDAVPTRDE